MRALTEHAHKGLLAAGRCGCALLAATALVTQIASGEDATGVLRIKTDVANVQVLADGVEAGRTPLTLPAMKAGKVKLIFAKPGFEDETRELDVSAGKTASLFVVMKKIRTPLPLLPVRFLAVHEHAKGRCRGQLVVHSDHLEYTVAEGPDNFQIPLTSITFLSRSTGPLFVIPIGAPTGGGGAVVGAAGIERTNPAGVLPIRVETKGRKYGFWVYEEGGEASGKTNELYQLLSRLVADASAMPQDKK